MEAGLGAVRAFDAVDPPPAVSQHCQLVLRIDKGYGHSFPLWSYVLSAAYLCVVLSADGFMICVGRLELSKFVGRYWLSACGALAAAALLRLVPEGGMIALLLLAYTPVLVLVPLLETLGIGEISPMMAAVGMFCLCNWLSAGAL